MKSTLPKVAIAGDLLLVLWVIFNAIDSGFSGTAPEKASFVGLIILLSLNAALIYKNR
jgi:hypothetical protein